MHSHLLRFRWISHPSSLSSITGERDPLYSRCCGWNLFLSLVAGLFSVISRERHKPFPAKVLGLFSCMLHARRGSGQEGLPSGDNPARLLHSGQNPGKQKILRVGFCWREVRGGRNYSSFKMKGGPLQMQDPALIGENRRKPLLARRSRRPLAHHGTTMNAAPLKIVVESHPHGLQLIPLLFCKDVAAGQHGLDVFLIQRSTSL